MNDNDLVQAFGDHSDIYGPDPEPTTEAGRYMLDGDLGGLPPRDLWRKHIRAIEAEARRPALAADDPVWQGAVGAMANMADFINNGKTTLADSDVANLKALLALDLSLIGKAFAALDAAKETP